MPDQQQYYVIEGVDLAENNGYFSSQQSDGRGYNRYNLRQHFASQSGLVQLPTGGPVGSPARIVRLCAPTSFKVITWVVEMDCEIGQRPVLPHWETSDPNEVFIRGEVVLDSPNIRSSGGIFQWRAKGEYHYASALAGRSLVSGGAAPSITLPPGAFNIGPGDFSRDFLASVASGTMAFGGLVFDDRLI